MLTKPVADRIDALRGLLATDPLNHFVRYALAQEFVKKGELSKAVGEFRTILAENPGYQAAYYHGGKALERLGRGSEARALYQRGVAVARKSGDLHALGELEAALEDSSPG